MALDDGYGQAFMVSCPYKLEEFEARYKNRFESALGKAFRPPEYMEGIDSTIIIASLKEQGCDPAKGRSKLEEALLKSGIKGEIETETPRDAF